jgi:hypothetical protein
MHIPLRDLEECDLNEFNYIYGWLIEQKKKETEEINKAMK